MLERDGLAGLTLRAVAREAACRMPRRPIISAILQAWSANSPRSALGNSVLRWRRRVIRRCSPTEQALARAHAYIGYAQAHPGLYGLMFRTERLDMSRPSLHEAANASFSAFAGAIGASRHEPISAQALTLDQGAAPGAGVVAGARFYHAAAGRPAVRCIAAASPRAPAPKPCSTPCSNPP